MQLLFAQDYSGAYGLVILFLLLGTCAVGIPRFRKVDPLARDKKKSKAKKKKLLSSKDKSKPQKKAINKR